MRLHDIHLIYFSHMRCVVCCCVLSIRLLIFEIFEHVGAGWILYRQGESAVFHQVAICIGALYHWLCELARRSVRHVKVIWVETFWCIDRLIVVQRVHIARVLTADSIERQINLVYHFLLDAILNDICLLLTRVIIEFLLLQVNEMPHEVLRPIAGDIAQTFVWKALLLTVFELILQKICFVALALLLSDRLEIHLGAFDRAWIDSLRRKRTTERRLVIVCDSQLRKGDAAFGRLPSGTWVASSLCKCWVKVHRLDSVKTAKNLVFRRIIQPLFLLFNQLG